MKTVKELVEYYVPKSNIMQLATSSDDQPWLCTVHYYSDEALNFYWCSTTERRHSKEIADNGKTASYILVHENTTKEDYVIGLSFEGIAELVEPQEAEKAIEGYVSKLGKDDATKADLLSGTKPFYRFTPTTVVMFNNKDFPENPRQELKLVG